MYLKNTDSKRLKTAKVVRIFLKNDKKKTEKNRSSSIPSPLSQVFEKIIQKCMVKLLGTKWKLIETTIKDSYKNDLVQMP